MSQPTIELNNFTTCQHEEKNATVVVSPLNAVGNIHNCPCYGIVLSIEERRFIDSRYQDFICRNCLIELKQGFVLFREKYFINAHK